MQIKNIINLPKQKLSLTKIPYVNANKISPVEREMINERKQAQLLIKVIPNDTWNKMSKNCFREQGAPPSLYVANIQNLKKTLQQSNIKVPDDVAQAIDNLEAKSTMFAERMNKAISKGKEPLNVDLYGPIFESANEKSISLIEKFLVENCDNEKYSGFLQNLRVCNFGYVLYDGRISKLSDDMLTTGQTFYHGTYNAKSITKNGFSLLPKKSQFLCSARELGEGVYLSPNRSVASKYAGVSGDILHVGVDLKNVAVVNDEQSLDLAEELRPLAKGAIITEQILKELFKRNGYNAVYTRNALGNGFFPHGKIVDILCGGKQSQLAVLDTSDIHLIPKTFSERFSNQCLQIKTFLAQPLRAFKANRKLNNGEL
jgi:hypothetical protein